MTTMVQASGFKKESKGGIFSLFYILNKGFIVNDINTQKKSQKNDQIREHHSLII